MALVTKSFEGNTPGASMTAANAGATQVSAVGTGATATFSDLYPHEGTISARFVASGSGLCLARFATAASNMTASMGVGMTVSATPTVNIRYVTLRGSNAPAVNIEYRTDNSIAVLDRQFLNPITVATGLQPGQRYYLTVLATVGSSTSTGYFLARLFNRAGTLLGSATSSAFDLGTIPITASDVGIVNTNSPANTTVYIDQLQLNDGSTAEVSVPTDAPVSYTGSLALSGTGTQTRAGSPSLTSTLDITSGGTQERTATPSITGLFASYPNAQQTRDATPTVTTTSDRSAEGDTTTSGSPVLTGSALSTGTGTQSRQAATALYGALSRSGAGVLTITSTPRLTGALDLVGTGTLTLAGRVYVPLVPRRITAKTFGSEASVRIPSDNRQKVRVL